MQHGFARAVALNFQDADGSLRRLTLQVKGLFQLSQRGAGLVEILAGLLRIDARQQLNLLHLQLGLAQRALGGFNVGLVLHVRRGFGRLGLQNLAVLIFALRLFVDRVAQLRLAIELDQRISLLHPAAAWPPA